MAFSNTLEAIEGGESLQVLGQPGPQSPETRNPQKTKAEKPQKPPKVRRPVSDGPGGEPAGGPSNMLAIESHAPRSGLPWGGGRCYGREPQQPHEMMALLCFAV